MTPTHFQRGRLLEETAFFEQNKASWLLEGFQRQYAVIHGKTLLGFFADYNEGIKAGYQKYGDTGFLVRLLVGTKPATYAESEALTASA